MHARTRTSVTIESSFQPVLNRIALALHRLDGNTQSLDHIDDLRAHLETVPMASDEFGVASNRLRNARRYLESSETGAARWELGILKQQLLRCAFANTREPRRRLAK